MAIAEVDGVSGETLWIGGRFESVGSVGAKHLATKRNGAWCAQPQPKVPVPTSVVHDIVEWDDGSGPRSKVVIAGEFGSVAGLAAHDVAAFDGVEWTALGDFGASSPIRATAVFQDPAWTSPRVVAVTTTDGARSWDGSSWQAMGSSPTGLTVIGELTTFRPEGATADLLYAIATAALSSGSSALLVWNGQEWVPPLNDTLGNSGYGSAIYDPPGPLGRALYIAGRPVGSAGTSS